MVDVKALRELAERWLRMPPWNDYGKACGDCADQLLALLAKPVDDALPEGWTRGVDADGLDVYTKDHTCDDGEVHSWAVRFYGDDTVDVESEFVELPATELHAVLTHYLSRKGSDR